MTNRTRKQKKGISTVLTTLIIVVASVVLGTAVTLFGTSLFQTGSQTQAITLSQVKIWNNSTTADPDTAVGAIVIRNTGDKIVAVDSIQIRGTTVPFGSWFFNTDEATTTNQQKQFSYGNVDPTGSTNSFLLSTGPGDWDIDRDGTDDLTDADGAGAATEALLKATGPISLDPGKGALIYFVLPVGVLTDADVGASTSISIFAGQVGQVKTVPIAKAAS